MKKNSFVYGALILGLASIICKILGAIFKIPLTYLVGSNGIGIYQLVYPIFALFLVICTSGIPVAISKIVSRENVNKNYINIKKIVKISFRLMLVLGIILAFLIIIFSGVISSFQGNSEISVCYLILAPSIIICSCISIFRGYFQGFEIMKFSAISQIIEQLFKLIFGLSFAYFFLSFGLIYGVFGAFLGLTLRELIALMYLFIVYKKKNLKIDFSYNKDKILSNFECAKIVIKESVPITLCSVLIPITVVVDSFIIIKLLNLSGFNFEISSSLYGLESGIVGSIINLPCVIAISLGISLMPAISASFASNNTKEISFKIKLALKIIWYFSLPCIIIFAIFSKEI